MISKKLVRALPSLRCNLAVARRWPLVLATKSPSQILFRRFISLHEPVPNNEQLLQQILALLQKSEDANLQDHNNIKFPLAVGQKKSLTRTVEDILTSLSTKDLSDTNKHAQLQELLMEYIQSTSELVQSELSASLALFYANAEIHENKTFFLNLLIRHNLLMERYIEAYALVVNNLQVWSQLRHFAVSRSTLELLIVNLLHNDYIMPAYNIIRQARFMRYNISARVWNLFIQRILAADVKAQVLVWIWFSVIMNNKVTYLSYGTLMALAEKIASSKLSGMMTSVNYYRDHKSAKTPQDVIDRMDVIYYNILGKVFYAKSWTCMKYKDLNNDHKIPIKATDLPLVVDSLAKINLKFPDRVFRKSDTKLVDDIDELSFLKGPHAIVFLNTYLRAVAKQYREENYNTNITEVLSFIFKLVHTTDIKLTTETFTYLFQIALVENQVSVSLLVYNFWRQYNASNKSDCLQVEQRVPLSFYTCNSLVNHFLNTQTHFHLAHDILKSSGFKLSLHGLSALSNAFKNDKQ